MFIPGSATGSYKRYERITASMFFRALTIVAFAAAGLLVAQPAADAQVRPGIKVRVMPVKPPGPKVKPPLQNLLKIKPAQAAAIAQRAMPGAKVVGVKRLPDGNYAVTLRTESDVSRIMIDGQTGGVM
jgi:hypothetical protein